MTEKVVRVPRLGDDLEPRLLEQPGDSLAEQHGVVGDHHAPCVAELGDGATERGKVAREIVDEHLVDALEVREPLEPVRAEIADLDAGDERRRGRGEQDLTPVARRGDPRGADHVQPGVALLAELGHAGVQADPHLDDALVRPVVVADPRLAGERSGEGRLGLLEDRGELVARRVDLCAAVGRDPLAEEPADVADQLRVRRAGALDEPRRALDVGEEERDGSGRQLGHAHECTKRLDRTPGVSAVRFRRTR